MGLASKHRDAKLLMPAPKSFLAHYGMCKLFIDCRQLAGVGKQVGEAVLLLPFRKQGALSSYF